MSADPYSDPVRTLFAHPRHAGDLTDAVSVLRDDQGVRLQLSMSLENGAISGLRFRARACPHLIAAAEAFCGSYEGRELAELLDFGSSEIMQSLSIPVEKTGRILVLEDAVRLLGQAGRERINQQP